MPTRQTSDPLTYDLQGQVAVTGLITTAQAAELLGVHPETVRRIIADGRLRVYKINKRSLRIDPADLEAYVATCAVEPWRSPETGRR